MPITFDHDYPFEYATVETVHPGVRRVVARNAGPFTFRGTGTFVIGEGDVAIVDPGPLVDEHVACLLEALRGETVTHLLVTHTHRDHSPACAPVKAATGARTYGYGPHGAGLIERGVQVEEGGDMAFVPDVVVRDGDRFAAGGFDIECVFTPGHTSNHVCFALREHKLLFCGDHVMAWNTSIISPPDGDLADYLASLERLLHRDDARYLPTHGPHIDDPHGHVRDYIEHRLERLEQIRQCLRSGVVTIPEMVLGMYRELPERMRPAAGRSVLASLLYLISREEVRVLDAERAGVPGMTSRYALMRS